MFEDFQLETPDLRGFITQREGARGVADIAALPIRRKDMNTDGNGFDPNQRFVEHLPDGFSAPIAVGLVGDEGTFAGNFMPRYGEIPLDMPLICGRNRLTTSIQADGRRKRVWSFPNGTRDIETVTGWFGTDNRCWLLQYGKLMTWVMESERTGDTGGNKSYHFNQATRNQSAPSTIAQNTILQVSASNVSTSGVFAVKTPSGAAQNVTLSVGDATAQTVAKFAAVGLTVAVAGSVALGAGEIHTLTGTNLAPNQSAMIYGAVSVNPSTATPSTVQAAIRALGGNFALRTVSGTITAPTPSTISKISVTGCSDATFNGIYSADGVFNGAQSYVNPSGRYIALNGAGVTWFMSQVKGGGATVPAFSRAVADGPIGLYYVNSGDVTAPTATASESSAIVPGNMALTIAVPSSAGNVADIEAVPGTGYIGASTPPGGGVGNLAITVNSPANSLVTISKVSGAGWSSGVTQPGNDGTGPMEISSSFIEATHWLVYKAPSKAALDAIDFANPGSALVKTAQGHSFSIENLAQAVYLEDGKVNPGSHVARRPNATASLTLAVQTDAGSGLDYAESIYATENLGGCGVEPFWLRFRAFCGSNEFWIDGKWSRNQQAAHPAQEGLAQWQFPLIRIHEASGSLFFTLIDAG